MAPFDENWLGDQVFFPGIVISLSTWGQSWHSALFIFIVFSQVSRTRVLCLHLRSNALEAQSLKGPIHPCGDGGHLPLHPQFHHDWWV